MQLRDLEWLVHLADVGHMTDAAGLLQTNQPNLSRSLNRIETELGAPLFIRAPRGMVLTPGGELVTEAAHDILARYKRMIDELATLLDPDAGTIRLAFLDSMATSLVPGILRDFHAQAPAMRVLLSQEPAHEIRSDLDSGAVDLAITSFDVGEPYGWHPIQEERLVVVVPSGHRLSHRSRIRLDDLEGDELVTTPLGFGHRALVDGLLRDAAVSLPISFESQDLETIVGLVSAGLGICIVPEPFAGRFGTVGIAITAAGARRTVGLAWRRDRPLAVPAERFREFVTAYKSRT